MSVRVDCNGLQRTLFQRLNCKDKLDAEGGGTKYTVCLSVLVLIKQRLHFHQIITYIIT